MNAGYGRKEIVDAVTEQMHKLAYYSPFPGSTNPAAIALSQKLIEITVQLDWRRSISLCARIWPTTLRWWANTSWRILPQEVV